MNTDAVAFNLAIQRSHFDAQQFRRATLIAARALERVADEFHLITLHFFLQSQPTVWFGLMTRERFDFLEDGQRGLSQVIQVVAG